MPSFVAEIAAEHHVDLKSILVQYLDKKTKAVDRGSKARRSLGNLYALYVLCEAYIAGSTDGTQFSTLLDRMRKLPFGSKLQNHPLDNRLNDEVSRQCGASGDMLPVQQGTAGGRKARKISVPLLEQCDADPEKAARFVVDVIDKYVATISGNQTAYLDEIQAADTPAEIATIVATAFHQQADARLFEVVTYALLHLKFLERKVTLIDGAVSQELPLTLYRTGRTNANDGGIDFVLKPLGKFFQVTETLDFRKYFLDFDKINRYALSFIIKTELTKAGVLARIEADAASEYPVATVTKYLALFDEIYTLHELREILESLQKDPTQMARLQEIIVQTFKLEYGMLD